MNQGMQSNAQTLQEKLRKLCDAVILHSSSFSEYVKNLEQVRIYLLPVVQLEETKLSGLSYRLDRTILKGSDLGKAYTPTGLAKRGICYDRAADLIVIHRCQKQEKLRILGELDPDFSMRNTSIHKNTSSSFNTPDLTTQAIQKQLTAFGVLQFEVGLRDQKTGRMINREWNGKEIMQQLGWLKHMNADGNDIYIRPAAEHGLILVDDLQKEKIQEMKRKKFTPTAIIETSPNNYQVWIKLTTSSLNSAIRGLAARELADAFDGDKNSADSKHYGRLAGFTNRKPQYVKRGKQPYVLIHEFSGEVALAASTYLEHLNQSLDQVDILEEQKIRLKAIKTAKTPQDKQDPTHEYKRQAKVILARYGESTDLSRLDWMIVTDIAKSNHFTQQEIENVLKTCSPNIESRKAGHIEDYAKRTVEKAWKAIQTEEYQEKQLPEQQAKRVCESNKGGNFRN